MRFRTGAEGNAACGRQEHTPHFLSVERKRAVPVQKKGVYIGSLDLEELHTLRNRVRCTWLRHESLRIVTVLQPRLTIVRRE